jgi:hypothetical protein
MSNKEYTIKNDAVPPRIKIMLNVQKRLIKKMLVDKSVDLRSQIREVNLEIKKFFPSKETEQVRETIVPGIWKAVK